jgi:hypothetical protein
MLETHATVHLPQGSVRFVLGIVILILIAPEPCVVLKEVAGKLYPAAHGLLLMMLTAPLIRQAASNVMMMTSVSSLYLNLESLIMLENVAPKDINAMNAKAIVTMIVTVRLVSNVSKEVDMKLFQVVVVKVDSETFIKKTFATSLYLLHLLLQSNIWTPSRLIRTVVALNHNAICAQGLV